MNQWYALYTKPRAEKKTADRLEKAGFEVYCPTYTTIRQWSDRKKKVVVPAIPSYIFMRLEEHQRYEVLQDHGVMNFVYWLGKPAAIKDEEINRLKLFLSDHHTEGECKVIALQPGDKATIGQGGLMGVEGIVQKTNKNKVYLLIESLGVVISCESSSIKQS